VTNCSDDLTSPGGTGILDPVDYGNRFAVDADNVRMSFVCYIVLLVSYDIGNYWYCGAIATTTDGLKALFGLVARLPLDVPAHKAVKALNCQVPVNLSQAGA